jgi:hypothetical protein
MSFPGERKNFEDVTSGDSESTGDSENSYELDGGKDALTRLLKTANSAEAKGNIDTAITNLEEYIESYRRAERKRRIKRAIEKLDEPGRLFAIFTEMSGFDKADIISPDDLSEAFPGYYTSYSNIEIRSSAEEVFQTIRNAHELQEKLDINFKLVVRPSMSISELVTKVEQEFDDSMWRGGRPVSYAGDDQFYTTEKPNEHAVALTTTDPIPGTKNKSVVNQTQALLEFVIDSNLVPGIEEDLPAAAKEFKKKRVMIERLIQKNQHQEAYTLLANLKANQLLRPTAVEKVSDYINEVVKLKPEAPILPAGETVTNSQFDDGDVVSLNFEPFGMGFDGYDSRSDKTQFSNLSVRL